MLKTRSVDNEKQIINLDTDVKDAVSRFIQDSVSGTNQDLNASICIPNTEEANSINSPGVSSKIDLSQST